MIVVTVHEAGIDCAWYEDGERVVAEFPIDALEPLIAPGFSVFIPPPSQ